MLDAVAPYPEYKLVGLPWLDSVPSHWSVKRGKSVFRCIDIRSKAGDEELLTVSAAHGVIPRRTATVTMFKAESYAGYKLCWPGDLVINSLWAWGRGLGVSRHHGIVSSAYGVYRLRDPDAMVPAYIDALVRSDPFNWELHVRSKGIWISRLQLTDESFLDAPFPLPPPAEQAGIVRFLGAVDRKVNRFIRAKRRLIEVLTEQKQAIITHAVTKGLNPHAPLKPSGINWLGDVPEHWRVMAVKRVLRRLIDCEHKTAPAIDAGGVEEYRVVRTTAVRYGRLRLSGTYCTTAEAFAQWTERGLPEPGDVIFTREAPAGEACIVPSEHRVCLGQRTVLMKLRCDRYDPAFLVHMIYAGPPSHRIRIASQGSTVGHFNMDDIADMQVYVPPLAEQVAIVAWITDHTKELDLATAQAEREIDLIREYRTRLVADVVTGKVDVRAAAAAVSDEDAAPAPAEPLPADDPIDAGIDDEEMPGDDEPELVDETTDAENHRHKPSIEESTQC